PDGDAYIICSCLLMSSAVFSSFASIFKCCPQIGAIFVRYDLTENESAYASSYSSSNRTQQHCADPRKQTDEYETYFYIAFHALLLYSIVSIIDYVRPKVIAKVPELISLSSRFAFPLRDRPPRVTC